MLSVAAEVLRTRIGAAFTPADEMARERVTTLAREALDEAAFAAAEERARNITPEAAVAWVLERLTGRPRVSRALSFRMEAGRVYRSNQFLATRSVDAGPTRC